MKITKTLLIGAIQLSAPLRAALDEGMLRGKAGDWLAYSELTDFMIIPNGDDMLIGSDISETPFEYKLREFIKLYSVT
jgi:hypothetical protein